MRAPRSIFAVAVAAALAACALKSPPERDELAKEAAANRQIPEKWTAQGGAPGAIADGWLASFSDPQLDELAREAFAYNPDLRVAAARVEQAAAYQKVAGALLYPQVNLLARGGGKMSGDASGLEGVGVFVNWELDLWGRVRSGAAAAKSQYVSAALDYHYGRQSIAAQVAKGWFLATEARMQKALADETVRASERLAGLARDRLRVGVGDEYDVRLAQANLQTFRDAAQSLDLAYQQALRSLETLAGRYPAAVVAVRPELAPAPAPVPVGMPSALLERRPDVVAAERRVAAAFYRIEEAKAARLPRISLTAAVTSISSELFVLKEQDNPIWSAGASLHGAAVPRRPAPGPGRGPHRGAETGGGRVRTDRRARVRRGGERAVGRLRARRARGDPPTGRRRERAGGRAREHPLPRRLGRPARRAAAEPHAVRGAGRR